MAPKSANSNGAGMANSVQEERAVNVSIFRCKRNLPATIINKSPSSATRDSAQTGAS